MRLSLSFQRITWACNINLMLLYLVFLSQKKRRMGSTILHVESAMQVSSLHFS